MRTKNWVISSALRKLWLYSKERTECLKQNNYSCQHCGAKRSNVKGQEQKIEVHHKKGVGNWSLITQMIKEELLCDPVNLECLCPDCHKRETEKQRKEKDGRRNNGY